MSINFNENDNLDVGFEDDQWADEQIGYYDPFEGKSSEQIAEEKRIPPWKNGRYELFVKSVDQPADKVMDCFLDGKKIDYHTRSVDVHFGNLSDPRQTIRITLCLPPVGETDRQTEEYRRAYKEGKTAVKFKDHNGQDDWKEGKATGFHASVFKHVLGRLGFEKDGRLVPEAYRLKNWVRWPDGSKRTVIGEVRNQKSNKPGDDREYANLEWFGFDKTDDTRAKEQKFTGKTPSPGSRAPAAAPAVTVSRPAPVAAPAADDYDV